MYNVAWGPNRIVNKTRRDLTQKLEKLDQIRELTRSSKEQETESDPQLSLKMSSPKPTFQPVINRHRPSNGRPAYNNEPMSQQHQELVKFFNDSWERVRKELDNGRQNGHHDTRGNGILRYERPNSHPALENFKRFDMEAYWGNRVYKNSTQPR